MIESPHSDSNQNIADYGFSQTKTLYAGVNPDDVEDCLNVDSGKLEAAGDVGESDYFWATEDLDVARSHSDGIIIELESEVSGDSPFSPSETGKQGYSAETYGVEDIVGVHYVGENPDFGEDLEEPEIEVDSAYDLQNIPVEMRAS